jgi:hypothetical protein
VFQKEIKPCPRAASAGSCISTHLTRLIGPPPHVDAGSEADGGGGGAVLVMRQSSAAGDSVMFLRRASTFGATL